MGIFSLPAPAGYRALPTGLLTLDSRSPNLLATPQPFPLTAAGLLAALGNPPGWTAANVLAIYNCDTASPLVDSLGLGPNLVAAGGPLTGRECCGLPDTTFASKVGVEFDAANEAFAAADAAFADANNSIISTLVVFRARENTTSLGLGTKYAGGVGYGIGMPSANFLRSTARGPGVGESQVAFVADSAWHNAAAVFDDVAKNTQLFSDVGDGALTAYVGNLTNAGFMTLGLSIYNSQYGQVTYFAIFNAAITSAMRAAFWRSILANSDLWGTDNTYTRANPLVAPITASRVACYGANQPATTYAANASAGDNALKTSVVCEDGASFLGVLSSDLITTGAGNWLDANTIGVGIDGPSGMRDAVRVTMTAPFSLAGSFRFEGIPATLVGATNVPFSLGGWRKRATVGTTAVVGVQYNGDPGGAESFIVLNDVASPVAWTPWSVISTPTRAAHTVFYFLIGANNNADNADHAELYAIKNFSTAPLAWRHVGMAAAAATSTPTLSYTNVGNARYNPARGRLRLRIAEIQRTATHVYFQAGAAASAGLLLVEYILGVGLYVEARDTAGVLVASGAWAGFPGTTIELDVEWDAAIGKLNVLEGAVARITSAPGPWVPEPNDVTPLYVGSDAAGANAARCGVVLLNAYNY